MKLTDLFDVDLLNEEIKNGYVRKTLHPTLPLAILNYTEKAAFDRHWNSVTRRCRGLIYRQATGEVIASGPAKFFNYGESSAVQYPLDTPVLVSAKEDGSLGIGWYYVDHEENCHYGYATRGSFTSEQANRANKLLHENKGHDQRFELLPDVLADYVEGNVLNDDGCTYTGRPSTDIVEIVYPENKIVLNYDGLEDLLPLGMVDNATGLIVWRSEFNTRKMTLAEALMLPIPEGKEGYVLDVLDPESGGVVDHLKLKGDWYKMMHAAIFGLTEKRVWEAWSMDASEFFEDLPDELQPWALAVSDRLDEEYAALSAEINEAYDAIFEQVYLTGLERKEFAIAVMKGYAHLSGALFACFDGDDAKKTAWIDNKVKPTKHVPFNAHDVQHIHVRQEEKVAA